MTGETGADDQPRDETDVTMPSSRSSRETFDDIKLPLIPNGQQHELDMHEGTPVSTPRLSDHAPSRSLFIFWVAMNVVATIFIVFLNRAVLTLDHFRNAPTLFVAFHFGLTSVCMHVLSSDSVGAFQRKHIPWQPVLPICILHGASTIITNASLAMLEVPTYQLMRVMLTPATVVLNLVLYGKTISWHAALCLGMVCLGVVGMTLADTQAKRAATGYHTEASRDTIFGYVFGMAGVVLAALYTIWIGRYHTRFEATSMQLLYVISPLSTALLWGLSPFVDRLPIWSDVTLREWLLVLGAGTCAVLINLSQFRIIAASSPVASTVVGHLKTCLIVAIGWSIAHTAISIGCGAGILTALAGIFAYSYVTMQEAKEMRR